MSVYSRLQLAWLTFAENSVATKGERELIVDSTNWKLVLHDGVTVGGKRVIASESYVQDQIGALTSGGQANFTQWLFCS